MKRTVQNLFSAVLILFSLSATAQEGSIKRADKKYDSYAYIEASKVYERVAMKGFKSPDVFKKLGNAYYFNGDLESANTWYAALFELTQEVESEYLYRYAQTLKATANTELAAQYLKQFNTVENNQIRAKLYRENLDYLEQIKANSGRYTLENLSLNSVYSDYGAAVIDQQLVFASARDTGSVSKKIHSWTNASFTSLYQAPILADGSVGKAVAFDSGVRSKFNESTPVFTKDGQTMYFTRNNFLNGKRGKDENRTTLLKIYSAQKVNGKWTNIKELPFNSDNYSTAHPALSPDGKWMYFSSDRSGTLGQSDLYRVPILAADRFGQPENLGNRINTEGRESFPFISELNELYFTSDGHPGLGGLDIFVVKIKDDNTLGAVQNIGAPANSPFDDFGWTINTATKKGFVSSNRKGGVGNDDIYSLIEMQPLSCIQKITGIVYDKTDQQKKVGAKMALYDALFNLVGETTTNHLGYYEFDKLQCGAKYRVNAQIPDYNTAEVTVELPNISGTTQVDFGLEKTKIIIEKGTDLFKALSLEPIYFDFDKSYIRQDAAVELAKVVEVLREYPKIRIDVRSHTDSRGDDQYNMILSQKRAEATKAWIEAQGIDKNRLSAKGYGETQLVNSCSNGVPCSEVQHQQNRRSEFIVLEM